MSLRKGLWSIRAHFVDLRKPGHKNFRQFKPHWWVSALWFSLFFSSSCPRIKNCHLDPHDNLESKSWCSFGILSVLYFGLRSDLHLNGRSPEFKQISSLDKWLKWKNLELADQKLFCVSALEIEAKWTKAALPGTKTGLKRTVWPKKEEGAVVR